jgi:sensor histidine kinase YesM
MVITADNLDYKKKSALAELLYLFFICVVSPLAVGLQIFSYFSYTLSLVLLNILSLPGIILFYRLYLPQTIGKRRYVLAIALFPLFLVVYDILLRLSGITMIHLPFIPQGYREGIKAGHPEDFTKGYFNQSIGYTSLVLLAATSLYVVKLLFKKQHHLVTLETEKLKLELNYLKAQVQPHFFFNTLNNLYALSMQGSAKAPQMITHLSEIMRYVLYGTRKEKVPLQQEVEFIKSYIALENIRHNSSDVIDFSVQGELAGIQIEPLLFLPLMENSFKHSLQKNLKHKWVKMVLTADSDEIVFQTSNPICREKSTSGRDQGGIGLMNLKQRLNLLYPDRHELLIYDEEDTFTVTLVISVHDHVLNH